MVEVVQGRTLSTMSSPSGGGGQTLECVTSISSKSRKRKAKTSSDPPKRRRPRTPARRRLLAPGVMGGRTLPSELSRFIIAGYENPRVFGGISSESGLVSGKDPEIRKQFIPTQPQVAAVLAKCLPRHLSVTVHQGVSSRTEIGLCCFSGRASHHPIWFTDLHHLCRQYSPRTGGYIWC